MAKIFTTKIRVQSYELDSFGHVNNAVYLQYLENARCDYMRQEGMSFNDFKRWNALPVVVESYLRYYHSLIADDVIEVLGHFIEWQHSSFSLEYQVRKSDGTSCLKAQLRFLYVNKDGKPVRIPEEFRKAFSDD